MPHRFVVAYAGDEPVGAALLTWSGDRLRGRSLHVGTAGEPSEANVFVEHNTLHVAPGHEQAFATALVESFREVGGWDRIVLDGFLPDAARLLATTASGTWVPRPLECPVTDLAAVRAAGGDVLAVLPSSRRARGRRTLRALGEVETEWCGDPASALPALEELADLNRVRWQATEQHTPFDNPRFVGFHRALVERLAADGNAWIFRLRDGEGTLGALYCLRDGGRVLFYQSGVRITPDNRLRPGVAAHILCINACAERGLDDYDFLAPPTRYKQELATGTEELIWSGCDRRSALAPLRKAARALRRRLRNGGAKA